MDILAAKVGVALKSHGMMLATAESCTGGGVAQAVTDISGCSGRFERGFITYSNLSKQAVAACWRGDAGAAKTAKGL